MLAGLLDTQHEASVAHFRDPLTGEIRHATAQSVGLHTSTHTEIHPASPCDAGSDACPLSASLHQIADHQVARSSLVAPVRAPEPTSRPAPALATRDVYLIAPKTSPPAIA
ncbi:MAG TPA: hypothetical protein VLX92_04350 [Kofleriaceae bacterium]|nr:hypothetical protein [Kofleriaceae bacterium]